jgi:1-acyl-sn-glycerol-3-phosphate acyltransferase
MALVDVYGLLPIHSRQFHPRPVKLIVGEPISTEGYTTRQIDAVNDRLREEVCRLYYENGGTERPKAATEEVCAPESSTFEPTQ